jgi:predicted membrane-bound mannosyltransferase
VYFLAYSLIFGYLDKKMQIFLLFVIKVAVATLKGLVIDIFTSVTEKSILFKKYYLVLKSLLHFLTKIT